jgi:AcrR family transcriptional regulator
VARPAKYSSDDILDVAGALVRRSGPASLSVSAVAHSLGAPSGSIYHRFESRDVLAASLWLRTIERFQTGGLIALANEDPREAVRASAAFVLSWSRDHLDDAQLLLLYRSRDLLVGPWPAALRHRNRRQRQALDRVVRDLGERLGAVTKADRRRVLFALFDIPYGAVRGPLGRGRAPEPELDEIVDDAVCAAIDGISARRSP